MQATTETVVKDLLSYYRGHHLGQHIGLFEDLESRADPTSCDDIGAMWSGITDYWLLTGIKWYIFLVKDAFLA